MLLKSLLIVSGLLPLLGYLRHVIDGKKPAYLLSPEVYTNNWLKENTWASRFSAIFVVFVFLFNLFAWAVYGIGSVIEFIGFLVKQVWWLMLWIWNEVLHPTVFAFIKLLWHYTIVMIWKFFQFSVSLVPATLNMENLFFAFKKLLALLGVSAFVLLIYLLTGNLIVLIVGLLIIFYFLQYSVFSTVAHLREHSYYSYQIFPNIQIVALWMIISAASTAIIVALKVYSSVFIVAGLGVSLSQFLIPVSLLTAIALLISTLYLPAFIAEFGSDFKIQDFLKAILVRLPKLILAQPLQILGLVLAGIIPVSIALLLNIGIRQTTGKSVREWTGSIAMIGQHIPTQKSNDKTIEYLTTLQKSVSFKKDSLTKMYDAIIVKAEKNLTLAKQLKAAIPADKIHTFTGVAYVGENQYFSIPTLPGCSSYDWEVKDQSNKVIAKSILISPGIDDPTTSYVFNHIWEKAGNYTVSLVPGNDCGKSVSLEVFVNVLDRPKKLPEINKPFGNTTVCSGKEAEYVAQTGFLSYQWQLPAGAQIVKNNANNSGITVRWGESSGMVRVKGTDKDGNQTNWAGIYVNVNALPGKETKKALEIPDEVVEQFAPAHLAYYISREAADESIKGITSYIESLKKEKVAGLKDITEQFNNINNSIASYTQDSKDQISMLISEILALIGLVLLFSIAFSSIWLYSVTYHYDLYDFEQDGTHYWRELLEKMQVKNPNQPLLGIFVLLVLLVVAYVVISLFLLKDWKGQVLELILKSLI